MVALFANLARSGAAAGSLEWRILRHWGSPGRRRGLLAGLGALGSWYQYQDGGDLQVASAEVLGGYAFAANDRWILHAMAIAGLGYGRLSLDLPKASGEVDFSGLLWDYGVEIGTTYRLSRRWRALGAVGWRTRQGDLDSSDFELNLKNQGLSLTIGLGLIVFPEPRQIE